jgi:hypothetical protein
VRRGEWWWGEPHPTNQRYPRDISGPTRRSAL